MARHAAEPHRSRHGRDHARRDRPLLRALSPPLPRPLSVAEIVDVALRLLAREWRALVVLAALALVPAHALGLGVRLLALPAGARVEDGAIVAADGHADPNYVLASAATALLDAFATLVAAGLAWRTVATAAAGGHAGWRASLAAARPSLGALLALALLLVAGVLAGAFLFVLPAIWLAVAWVAAVPALMAEGRRGGAALARSWELVRGRWWRTFGVLLVAGLLAGAAATLIAEGLARLAPAGGGVGTTLGVDSASGLLGALVATPLQVVFLSVVYLDLRVRAGDPAPVPRAEPEEPRWLPPVPGG